MTTVARLSADLYANTGNFETGMRRADRVMGTSGQKWRKELQSSERGFRSLDSRVNRTITNFGGLRTVAVGLFAAISGGKLTRYSDEYVILSSRLKLATDSAKQFQQVQKDLFDVAQETGTPLSANIEAYTRLSQSLDDTQKKQFDLVRVTQVLSKTLALSGTTGQYAGELIRQFGQAASSDFKSVAQEINSIQDQAPRFAQLLKEAFADTGKSLKQLAADGELSTERVLNALLDSGALIDKEFSSLGGTVRRSLQQLDNELLKYVGNSEAIKAGTATLAGAINVLANNIGLVAQAFTAFGLVLAARVLPSYLRFLSDFAKTRAIALINAQSLSIAAQSTSNLAAQSVALATAQKAALGSMAQTTIFVNSAGTAVAASTTLFDRFASSVGLLGRGLLALVGGPVGLAVIAIYGLTAAYQTYEARSRQALEADKDTLELKEKLATAMGKERAELEKSAQARLNEAKATIENNQALIAEAEARYTALNANRSYFASKVEIPAAQLRELDLIKQLKDEAAQARANIKALESDLEKPVDALVSGGSGGGADSLEKKAKTIETIISSLRRESEQVQLQAELYGQKEGSIRRATRAAELENEIKENGLKLTKQQREQIEQYLDNIERQINATKRLEEEQEKIKESERQRQQALENYGFALESAFEDAIINGERLRDVMQGLARDVARIALRNAITQPATTAISSFFSSASIFSGLPSFDVGSYNVPSDMVANIHKGEMIIPAKQAAQMRSGGGAGNEFKAEIHLHDNSANDPNAAQSIVKVLDSWWNEKLQNSARIGNPLNPIF